MKELFSDILFECKMKSGDEAYCAVLIEHKSYKDPYAGFQIGEYLFSAYRHQIKNREHFKIIIPILFYHHEQKWEFQPVEAFFKDNYKDFIKFVPKFETIFFDVKSMQDESILAIRNIAIASMLMTQKHDNDIHVYRGYQLHIDLLFL